MPSSIAEAVNDTFPTIEVGPDSTTVDLFGPLEFACVAFGNPHPMITWYKDGTPITGEGSPFLLIEETHISDRAVYHCTATNTFGSASSDFAYVYINGKSHSLHNMIQY